MADLKNCYWLGWLTLPTGDRRAVLFHPDVECPVAGYVYMYDFDRRVVSRYAKEIVRPKLMPMANEAAEMIDDQIDEALYALHRATKSDSAAKEALRNDLASRRDYYLRKNRGRGRCMSEGIENIGSGNEDDWWY